MVKSISVLGCTGSIGRQTIAVAEHIGMPVAALTANRKIDLLEEQARRLHPRFVAVYDEQAAKQFKIAVADTDIQVGSGIEGLIRAATMEETDCVVTAVSGAVGLKPTLAAIDGKKRIALAKQYEAAVTYLEQRRLGAWVHNKTIQKARESFRVSQEQKEYLKSLKVSQ